MTGIIKKNDTNFRRGYRLGLKSSTEMIRRFAAVYEDNAEVKRILTIISQEIPLIGMSLSAMNEDSQNEASAE